MVRKASIALMAMTLLATGATRAVAADQNRADTSRAATVGLLGQASSAPTSAPQNNFSGDIDPTGPWTIKPDHRTLQFGDRVHWGLKLDMEQPLGRDMSWKDVKAGAYLHLSPNIRVGGSVNLGDKLAQPQKLTPQDTAPRVHLETAFKF